jgi:hypothetical protein
MSLRFRKSIKLAPGVRMNFSGSGLSMTLGPRGASFNVGSRGTYFNAGIPGTGLYSRTKLSGGNSARRVRSGVPPALPSPPATVQVPVHIDVEDDGRLTFKTPTGELVHDRIAQEVKKQKGPELRALLDKFARDKNDQIEALEHIHWSTPDPSVKPSFEVGSFTEPEPELPSEPHLSFLARSLPWRRKAIEARYSSDLTKALAAQDDWIRRKALFVGQQVRRKIFVQSDIYKDVAAMESFLEEHLKAITWPRETHVTFQIENGGAKVVLDVDLPEIEQLPNQTWTPATKDYSFRVKVLSESRLRQVYVEHVQGIGFRIIGETFAALPTCNEVVLSAYSQRPDPQTGNTRNDYLYSVRVERLDWQRINFRGLRDVNVVDALNAFELRRDLSNKGVFRPIVPIP